MKKIFSVLGFLLLAALIARPAPVLSAAGNVVCLGLPALIGDATLSAGTCTTAVGKILGVTINSVPASGNLVGTTDAQTLSSKTLASPALTGTVTGNSTIPLSILSPLAGSIASAGTVDIGASFASGSFVTISGTTGITSFGSAAPAGSWYLVQFSGTLTVTSSVNLVLPNAGASISTAGSPILLCSVPVTAGTWNCTNALTSTLWAITPGGTISTQNSVTGAAFIVSGTTVPANGTYRPAASTLGFSSNSTAAGRIDASQRLLWGYTADQGGGEPLQVNGGIYANGKVTATNVLDSGLTASTPVYTDASKNLTSTAPAGYSAVLSGTSASLGGGALLAGACSNGTTTVTGATTSMTVSVSAAGGTDPGDDFYVRAYVSAANTVTVKVCAAIAGTPTATTYNVRVLQ